MNLSTEHRAAMLKAADHIEKDPDAYNFMRGEIPTRLYGCGCALAWIGYFLGLTGRHHGVAMTLGYSKPLEFYETMDALAGKILGWDHNNPKETVRLLRHLATE